MHFHLGLEKQGKSPRKFYSLPYPQLQRIANKWNYSGKEDLLFVGTEMPAYGYRLGSRPNPLQTIAYRKDKAVFLKISAKNYRPKAFTGHISIFPGTLQDAAWLLPRFPHIQRAFAKGSFCPEYCPASCLSWIITARQCLKPWSRTPLLSFLEPGKLAALSREAEKFLEILARAGIWFCQSSKSKQKKVRNIWGTRADMVARNGSAKGQAPLLP